MNTINHFEGVAFDFDGTMFDTLPSLTAATNDTLARYGMRQVTTEQLRPALSEGLRSMFNQALKLQEQPLPTTAAPDFLDACMDHYMSEWFLAARLYPQVANSLRALQSEGLKLAVCTNRDHRSTYALLEASGIADLFDTTVGMGDAALPKPAAEPLLLVMERVGIPAEKALLVGDSLMDCACARNAGVRFVAHLAGYASNPQDLEPNVFSFERYGDFTHWVLSHQRLTKELFNA